MPNSEVILAIIRQESNLIEKLIVVIRGMMQLMKYSKIVAKQANLYVLVV